MVIYPDDGPNNAGTRTRFLRRWVESSDWSGLTLRLVCSLLYHSKYNPTERCGSALERKWNGALLTCLKVVLQCALRMFWNGRHLTVKRLEGDHPDGIRVTGKAKKKLDSRPERSPTLRKYDLATRPNQVV